MSYLINSKFVKLFFFVFLALYFMYKVLANAPAAWAAWAAHQAVPTLWLSSVKGSLWQGTAQSAQVELGQAPLALGKVSWSLKPWSMLKLQFCLDFSTELPGQSSSGELCQSMFGASTDLADVRLDAPISVLKDILPIDASGYMSIVVREASFTPQAEVLSLDGQFSWENARVNTGTSWIALGTFAATAKESDRGGVVADIFDIQSPYKSELNAEWLAGEDWRIAGTIAPQANAEDIVVQGLNLIGEDQGQGVFRVQWP